MPSNQNNKNPENIKIKISLEENPLNLHLFQNPSFSSNEGLLNNLDNLPSPKLTRQNGKFFDI